MGSVENFKETTTNFEEREILPIEKTLTGNELCL